MYSQAVGVCWDGPGSSSMSHRAAHYSKMSTVRIVCGRVGLTCMSTKPRTFELDPSGDSGEKKNHSHEAYRP